MLSNLAVKSDVSPESWEAILSGDIDKIDKVINEATGGGYLDALDYLVDKDDAFQNDPALGWDIDGNGVPKDYFLNLFTKFPGRQLTADEVKKITNISEQVEMLQQTLKYWLQICRDNHLSIARNI